MERLDSGGGNSPLNMFKKKMSEARIFEEESSHHHHKSIMNTKTASFVNLKQDQSSVNISRASPTA